jgi:cobalamin biosynthesis protein CobT
LKVRAEERNTKFNRQRTGRIDKRMIANAGFGAEAIFEKIESFAYNPGLIHISIDNSGSMNGTRFENAQKAAVAIAKACSMIENMDCIISYRSSAAFGTSRWNFRKSDVKPVVLIAYDSRIHGMAQIKTLLPYVETASFNSRRIMF